MTGKVEVRHGPMGANKTSKMIEVHLETPYSFAFLPGIDTRSGGALVSHAGVIVRRNVKSIPEFDKKLKILEREAKIFEYVLGIIKDKDIKRICFDETNFFPQAIIGVIERLATLGFDIHAVGLLLDSDLKDFGPTRSIAKIADVSTPLYARCDITEKNNAVYNYTKGKKEGQIQVGAFDLYGASAPKHLNYLRVSNGQTPIPDEIVFSEIWKVK